MTGFKVVNVVAPFGAVIKEDLEFGLFMGKSANSTISPNAAAFP